MLQVLLCCPPSIIDGRDCFGADWGSSNNGHGKGGASSFTILCIASSNQRVLPRIHLTTSTAHFIGLMPQFPHFITEDPPTSYDSGISNNNDSQHVQWDDCYEDEDDGYRYSQYHQQMQEEKGRRQSK